MSKVAIVVLANTETHEGLGRVVNALEAVKEFKDGRDDVQLVFDGAGAKWIPELEKPDHKLHGLYSAVKDRIGGVCDFCAGAFGVKDAVVAGGGVRGPSELQEPRHAGVSGHHVLAPVNGLIHRLRKVLPKLLHGQEMRGRGCSLIAGEPQSNALRPSDFHLRVRVDQSGNRALSANVN